MATTVDTSYQGTPSLGSSVFVQIRDPTTGFVISARTNSGVREDIAGSGFYVWSGSLTDLTAYEAIWDEGAAPYAGEIIIPQSTSTGGGGGGGGVIALATTSPATVNPLVFTIKRNDTDPSIVIQALVPDPANPTSFIPWPIPGGSVVKFTMRDNADLAGGTRTAFAGAPKVHATANIDDAPNGMMSYGWVAADTDTDGLFRAEFEVTSGAETRTFPVGADASRNWIAITIVDDLDPGINP